MIRWLKRVIIFHKSHDHFDPVSFIIYMSLLLTKSMSFWKIWQSEIWIRNESHEFMEKLQALKLNLKLSFFIFITMNQSLKSVLNQLLILPQLIEWSSIICNILLLIKCSLELLIWRSIITSSMIRSTTLAVTWLSSSFIYRMIILISRLDLNKQRIIILYPT